MDDYLISWRLTNDAGETLNHPQHGYPLGLDMWWRDYKLRFLRNGELQSYGAMMFVSSAIMKMVSRPTSDGRTTLRFKGKSSPMDDRTPWSYLHWYPESRAGQVPHHILMRFGTPAPTHVRKPGRDCPMTPIRYLLHRTDLLRDADDDSAPIPHELCYFDIPVGIFWGLIGLRTLNRWWVVPELVEDGDWFSTHDDPASYRPVNATLPRGVYLKVRIGVLVNRPPLRHCYFRFAPRGEIVIDDPAEESDAEGPARGESDNDDHPDLGSGRGGEPVDVQGGELVMYGTRSHEEQSFSYGRSPRTSRPSRRHTGHGFYGSPQQPDVMMMSPPSHGGYIPAPPRRRTTHDRSLGMSSPPSIPDSLKFEELYISRQRLGPDLFLEQTDKDLKNLVRRGTGLDLENNLSSSFEESPVLPEIRRHQRYYSDDRYHKYENEDEDDRMDSEDMRYPENEYSDDDRPRYRGPRSDLPLVPNAGEEFEDVEYAYPDSDAYHKNIHHDARGELRGFPSRRRDHPSRRRSHYSHRPEEEEGSVNDSALGSPHGYNYVPSGYRSDTEGRYYEGHEADSIGMYSFQGSPALDSTRYREGEEDEAVLAAEEEQARRRRRKKKAY
ncbi:hypothetical protein TWF281_005455 [Arthrobotrys megalospora]